MSQVSKYEAAILVGMSPELLDWFASYSPKKGDTRKLASSRDKFGVTTFSTDDLENWDEYLREPWPETQRQPPLAIERELFLESQGRCTICQSFVVCEMAHIDPWEESFNHHPHNLIHLCPTCHTRVDRTNEIPREVVRQKKQELIDRRAQDWRLAAKNHADLLSAPISQSRDESVQILLNITFSNAVMQNPKIGEDFARETGFPNITGVPLNGMDSAVKAFGDIYSRYFPTAGSSVSVITQVNTGFYDVFKK